MKRIENYNGYVIDVDNLGRVYIHNLSSPYFEDSDKIIIGHKTKLLLKDVKKIIDLRNETNQDIRSL